MENLTIEHFIPFIEAHRYLGYLLLFLAMIFEGEIVLIFAAILSHVGAFELEIVFIIALIGVILGNIVWYYAGIATSRNTFVARVILPRAEHAIHYFLPRFCEKPFKSIFFSKFIYGVNHAVVFMSGVMRVRFLLFVKAESLASVVWVGFYSIIGYLFGYAAIQITHTASRFVLITVLFVVVFILLQKFLVYLYERRKHQKDRYPQR